jgi:hypothetical protein
MKTTFNKIDAKSYIDPDTETVIFPREVDGEACLYVLYNSPISKQFAGNVLLLKDIDFSINCLKKLTENIVSDKDIQTALLFSAIVTYMKCFTSGSERRTHLHVDLFKKTHQKYLKLHNEIDEFRDNYLAHASTQTHEKSSSVLFLNPDISKKKLIWISIAAKYVINKNDRLSDYIDLMEKVKELVNIKIKKSMKALKDEVNQIDINEHYFNAKAPDKTKYIDIDLGKYREKY